MKFALLILAGLVLHLYISHGATASVNDADCSGHGSLDDQGVCICDTSWPETGSDSPGWVGEKCSVPVYPGSDSEGEDMAAACSKSEGCNELAEDAWVCFAVQGSVDSWNFLSISLNRTEGEGDADLFGFFKNATTQPNFAEATGFAFQDTSTSRTAAVLHSLTKTEFPEGFFDGGYYACVHNYPGTGSLKFSLKAFKERCPTSFDLRGLPLLCSTPKDASEEERRFTECSDAGECLCKAPYAKPVDNVYPDLGFESCAAEVTMISDEEASHDQAYEIREQHVDPQAWRFWGFNTSSGDFEVVVNVAEREEGHVAPFARFGVPPGAAAGQFDERSGWNPASGNREHQIVLDSSTAGTRTGLWFVGVFGGASGGMFDMSLQKFSCPGNCSSNGICEAQTHQCSCVEGYGGADCSVFSEELTFNSTVDKNSSAVFEYEYFSMPEVTDEMLNGNVEVQIIAQCSSSKWNMHLAARPEILLSLDPEAPGTFPSARNFTQRMILDLDKPHTLTLCASQLVKGSWKVALHNPLPSIPLNYTLTITKIGRCLNDCSQNGECSVDGVCECLKGWAGGDCSVEVDGSGGGKGKPPRRHPFFHFLGTLFIMSLGAAAAFAYVSFRGIPRWLPMQTRGLPNVGLYNELIETDDV